MSIKGCPDCQGTGWLYMGHQKKYWCSEPSSSDGPEAFSPWEPCWCSLGEIVEGPPVFWNDSERVNQVFIYPYEDLEKAVSDYLNDIELSPEQIRLLKFYIAQWLMKDPQPPWKWLDRLSTCCDLKSLRDYIEWLKAGLIKPL